MWRFGEQWLGYGVRFSTPTTATTAIATATTSFVIVSILLFWPRHEQNLRKELDKHTLDPLGHGVRARRPIIPIDYDDRIQNGDNVHHERENQVLRNERYDHGGGR